MNRTERLIFESLEKKSDHAHIKDQRKKQKGSICTLGTVINIKQEIEKSNRQNIM